ncbi:uncharacterized protein [Rutidosis leptorrhynchoides]|uniref:uncharacterized protein n=1 Tax=Rutidosis leptorrhynchoides TaxID=125765 RepID=UPI003A9A0A5D
MEYENSNSDLTHGPRLRIFGILRESIKTIKRNAKLLAPVLVLAFLLFSHLKIAQTKLLEPAANDLSLQLAKNPNLFQSIGNNLNQADYSSAISDIREILFDKFFIMTFSSIISLLFLIATVSSSSEAYVAKVIDIKEMIMKIKQSWKKPILTIFFMIIITLGLIFVLTFSFGVISIVATDSLAYMLYGVLSISIVVLGFYGCAIWIMSLVVSILEDVSGLYAINRALEVMKGKKVQASLIIVLFAIMYGFSHLLTDAVSSYTLYKWSRLAVSIPFATGLDCALKLLLYVVFTVFYHELKERCIEKETKGLYVPIVNAGDQV